MSVTYEAPAVENNDDEVYDVPDQDETDLTYDAPAIEADISKADEDEVYDVPEQDKTVKFPAHATVKHAFNPTEVKFSKKFQNLFFFQDSSNRKRRLCEHKQK